jgi:predicted DNA-binding protein (MmcQ/YjbR family)
LQTSARTNPSLSGTPLAGSAATRQADAVKAGAKTLNRLLELALSYPEAWEDHPWDETVVKVRKKIFVFAGIYDSKLSVTVKLPESRDFALSFEWTEPTGYGLGRAGWVSVRIPVRDDAPVDLLEEWIDESYRAVAPKTLVRLLET